MKEKLTKVKEYFTENPGKAAYIGVISAYGLGVIVGRLTARETIEISGKTFQDGKVMETAYIRTVK